MTKAERMIVLCLVFFLLLGVAVRVGSNRNSRVDFKIAKSGNLPRKCVDPEILKAKERRGRKRGLRAPSKKRKKF